jgi:hypothetical protein
MNDRIKKEAVELWNQFTTIHSPLLKTKLAERFYEKTGYRVFTVYKTTDEYKKSINQTN